MLDGQSVGAVAIERSMRGQNEERGDARRKEDQSLETREQRNLPPDEEALRPINGLMLSINQCNATCRQMRRLNQSIGINQCNATCRQMRRLSLARNRQTLS